MINQSSFTILAITKKGLLILLKIIRQKWPFFLKLTKRLPTSGACVPNSRCDVLHIRASSLIPPCVANT